jgi:hypothetical protein
LRLAFQVTLERIEALKLEKPFLKLEPVNQGSIVAVLGTKALQKRFVSREAFEKELTKVCKAVTVKLSPPVKKALFAVMSERDEESGNLPRQRRQSRSGHRTARLRAGVPLSEDWVAHFEREVKPFAADAWVDQTYRDETDGKVGRVGYEINFNRYFYKYVAPRPVSVIDQELSLACAPRCAISGTARAWRNGRRTTLKMSHPKGSAGSSPAARTTSVSCPIHVPVGASDPRGKNVAGTPRSNGAHISANAAANARTPMASIPSLSG